MPLLRQSLYSQNVNLYLAPTADGREMWLPLMRTVACEGRCVVLSANQCLSESKLPDWIREANKSEALTASEKEYSNGRSVSTSYSRQKPTKLDDRHEVVFPDKSEDESPMSARSSGEYMRTPSGPFGRRKSLVIANGHEIALPKVKEPDNQSDQTKSKGKSNDNKPAAPKLRRSSTITIDGHEIVLPGYKAANDTADESQSQDTKASKSGGRPFRVRRASTVTDDGHEIVLPGIEESSDSFVNLKTDPKPRGSELISRGGSCIISPTGEVLMGPLWDDENGLLVVDVDFDDCLRGRLDLDVGGSYSR